MTPRITRTNVDSVNWTRLLAPVACDYVAFYAEGGAEIAIRSDDGDSATEKRLPGEVQETIATSPSRFKRDTRFTAGETVFFLKTVAGTDVVVATWSGILG